MKFRIQFVVSAVCALMILSMSVTGVVTSSSLSSNVTSDLLSPFWLQLGHDSRNTNSVPWQPSHLRLNYSLPLNGLGYTLAAGKVIFVSEGKSWGSSANKILAINMSSGKILWSLSLNSNLQNPLLTASGQGLLFVGSKGSTIPCSICRLIAVNETTGKVKWNSSIAAMKPAFANNMVYVVTSSNNTLYALNALTGKKVWSHCCVIQESYGGPVAIADGRVFFSSYSSSRVYSINASNGRSLWNTTTIGNVTSYPVVRDGRVFVGTRSGLVYALGEVSGKVNWTYVTGYETYVVAVANHVLITTGPWPANTILRALNDTTGKLLWSYGPKMFPQYGVSIAGSEAIMISFDNVVRAFNLLNGTLLGSFPLPGAVMGIQVRIDLTLGHIIVPTTNSMYVFIAPKA